MTQASTAQGHKPAELLLPITTVSPAAKSPCPSAPTAVMRFKKLTRHTSVLDAARHNRRAIAAELGVGSHIESALSGSNVVLVGGQTPEDVAARAKHLMASAGVGKLRKDAVRAIEIVFSLPPQCPVEPMPFFRDCVEWTATSFCDRNNILSADVHFDEGAPHCHVLVLPLIGGRMVGSDLMGGPAKLKVRQEDFHACVGAAHGMRSPQPKARGAIKAATATAVRSRLQQVCDPVLSSQLWPGISDCIRADPTPWAHLLGIEVAARKPRRMRSSTAIFTSPGKGPRRETDATTWRQP